MTRFLYVGVAFLGLWAAAGDAQLSPNSDAFARAGSPSSLSSEEAAETASANQSKSAPGAPSQAESAERAVSPPPEQAETERDSESPPSPAQPATNGVPFSRAWLVEEAKRLSKQPFAPATMTFPPSLANLTYDQYRSIRFKTAEAIWAGQHRGFSLDLLPPGFYYKTPVQLNLVEGNTATPLRFDSNLFDYGAGVQAPTDDSGLSYAGFAVRSPIKRPDYSDIFLVFQGASYFRAVGRDESFGLSARGLAIKTARPEGEEFPIFTRFWIERPAPHAQALTVHALLDSPSVVGAYTFRIAPGEETSMEVQATLFPRTELSAFGIAPLTSMFLFDESNRAQFDDFRDAVHDSDGVQMINGNGERIFRPLANPKTLQVSSFLGSNPQGFGLVQRERKFTAYQDYEARYDLRPSAWIEPNGDWGDGHVELVEIPSRREINDNIVLFWQPAESWEPGMAHEFSYRLLWGSEPPDGASLARVDATRSGLARDKARRDFVVDFRPPGEIPNEITPQLTASGGQILHARTEIVQPTGRYRVSFELDPEGADSIDMRLVLMDTDNKPWSETWLYRWTR
jgi:glucans biosynthesis protein